MDNSIDKLFDTCGIDNLDIPQYGWKAKLDLKNTVKCHPFTMPRPSQVYGFIMHTLRYLVHVYWPSKKSGKRPFIDCLNPVSWKPIYGVPMGGIGGGAINRGFRGEFCRYSLVPGLYEYDVVGANQFIVTIRRRGATVYQQVLSVHEAPPDCPSLNCWNWQFPGSRAAYLGLFPRAWTVYDIPEQRIKLICRQTSPVIPNDYKDSCLPLCVFDWTVLNYGKEAVTVSLTFVLKNGMGTTRRKTQPQPQPSPPPRQTVSCAVVSDGSDVCDTVAMEHQIDGMALCYGLGAMKSEGVSVTTCSAFCLESLGPGGDIPGPGEFWASLMATGTLSDLPSTAASYDKDVAMAVSVQTTVQGQSSCSSIRFVFAWHMPRVHFKGAEVEYTRRYARWFTDPDMKRCVHQMIEHAMTSTDEWTQKIVAWQRPTLEDKHYPDWYKSAIFNELYFLVDGGTVWLDRIEPIRHTLTRDSSTLARQQHQEELGIFGYLEGHEYRLYNTYDVHHYSSWALVMLWPRLQETIQYDIADVTRQTDNAPCVYLNSGIKEPRSAAFCPPHDLGDPEEEPFRRCNAYIMYNTDYWKDLGPKFVLQVYRDWKVLKNEQYMQYMLPVVMGVMKNCLTSDKDGDGVIENSGHADQTYDAWMVKGVSAYTGGLWLAALYGLCDMADHAGIDCAVYRDALARGKGAYEAKLWTGTFYRYDEHSTVVMADQLCGHWYLKSVGVPDNEVFDRTKVLTTLKTIFRTNCMCVCGGTMGAVNGCYPNGKVVTSSVQSEEFWVGVNYSVGATMILEGDVDEAWRLTEGVYRTVYERYGLQYQTPEAYFENGRYRSLGYMRPLAIWAMEYALDQRRQQCLE